MIWRMMMYICMNIQYGSNAYSTLVLKVISMDFYR